MKQLPINFLNTIYKAQKEPTLFGKWIVFKDLENPFTATRYHSLVVEKDSLPDCFEITAWTNNENGNVDEIMGIKHKDFLISGVQFHPESILTSYGHELLRNFLLNNN